MCPIGLYDSITVSPATADIVITSNSSHIPLDSGNLAFQAAALLMKKGFLSTGAAINLEKQIPVGGGLGGGSSDAATVLSLLNDLAALGYSRTDLMAMAGELGSDIPFFLCNSPAWATGRGEVLSSLVIEPEFWVVLVTPPFSVSSAWAYQQWQGKERRAPRAYSPRIDLLAEGTSLLVNDLEKVVMSHYPEIGAIKDALNQGGAWGSLMSGSGSTVFGIFFSEDSAWELHERLLADHRRNGWTVSVVPALV